MTSTGRKLSGALLLLCLSVFCAILASGCSGSDDATPTIPVEAVAIRTPRPTFTPPATATTTQVPATATPTATATATLTPTPTRADNISPLTGLEADPELIHRRVLAFRVGNDPGIRPQDGLGAADIVYEEIMDGWTVTRFTALFLESEATRVRPLRSARLANLTMVPQYDAALVHTGASDPIRYLISQATFVDLDQYFHPAPYGLLAGYDWRGRMYSSTDAVRKYLEKQGLEREELIEGYAFDPEPPDGEPALAIRIPYPSSTVDWTYDDATGLYLRKVSNQKHLDALTGDQITASNVILFYTEHKRTNIVEDTNGATAIDIVMTGTGRAVVIRDGVQVEAEWRRTAEDEVIQYWDADGEIIPLKPGKTWIEMMPPDHEVTIG
ncbi:MAG: DUF3048 C-terminal domain-containing protein [Anaerolineae bacterium]